MVYTSTTSSSSTPASTSSSSTLPGLRVRTAHAHSKAPKNAAPKAPPRTPRAPKKPSSMTHKRDAAAALEDEAAGAVPSSSSSSTAKSLPPKKEPTEEQKNRDLKQTKRMKRLLVTDPVAAEKMDYRRRVGLARRDEDVATALTLFGEVQSRDIDIGPEGFNALIALFTSFEQQVEADAVFAHMRTKKMPMTEATYVSMMRALALGAQQPEAAEALLDEMVTETKQRPRLRSYSPIVIGYAQQGKTDAAFALYEKMLAREIEPTEAEMVALLKACTMTKEAPRFFQVLAQMQDIVLEPAQETWDAVVAWFGQQEAGKGGAAQITHPVRIDKAGVCGGCGETLDSIDLSPQGAQELLTKVEELVLADAARAKDWAQFKAWLEQEVAGPTPADVVVDGANVGYFQMNYADAPPHVNYDQIAWVLEHFSKLGKRPLLVLHARHVDDRKVPHAYYNLVQSWKGRGLLLTVPYRSNDDWFWLYTTVFKGGRTLLVTNDEMRDHHFQMLSQKAFLRWKERHQVYFNLGGYEGNARAVKVTPPAHFSKCIQGPGTLSTPAAATGGGGKKKAFWHFPRAESEEWLCVQSPASGGGN